MKDAINEWQLAIETSLKELELPQSPANLYEPMRYILALGGKRIRPVLCLLGAEMYGASFRRALPQALAVEVFHNFTLVHDDIMDQADVRRKLPTVHRKWNENVAILSGDAMLVKAYQLLAQCDAEVLPKVLSVFSDTALEVCEGQQFDMDFADPASRSDVQMEEYAEMIRLKTAVLLRCSMQLGAIVAGAPDDEWEKIRSFTENLGLAFQVRDDYLDAFGDESFGKVIGGDIREGKRTWLTLKTLELAAPDDRQQLLEWYGSSDLDARVTHTLALYTKYGIQDQADACVRSYSEAAMSALASMRGEETYKEVARALVGSLMGRAT